MVGLTVEVRLFVVVVVVVVVVDFDVLSVVKLMVDVVVESASNFNMISY